MRTLRPLLAQAALVLLLGALAGCGGCQGGSSPDGGAVRARTAAGAAPPEGVDEDTAPGATQQQLRQRAAEAAAAHKATAAQAAAAPGAFADAGSAGTGPGEARSRAHAASKSASSRGAQSPASSADDSAAAAGTASTSVQEASAAERNAPTMDAAPAGVAEEACTQCHARLAAGKKPHDALRAESCAGCHAADPSASGRCKSVTSSRWKVSAAPAAEACASCHQPGAVATAKVSHTPFREGQCLGCHAFHGSANPALLKEVGAGLCQSCHAREAKRVEPRAQIDLGKAVVHAPVADPAGCQLCHTQKHGGESRSLLAIKGGTAETCFKCHDRFDDLEHPHGAVKLGRCTGCHDPHSSSEKGLLKGSPKGGVCFNCHSDDLSSRRVVHQPLKDKGCLACHAPHGSNFANDLAGAEGKELCFKCHKRVDEVQHPHAALARYGCTACHDPHGAAEDGLLHKPVNALCTSCHEEQKDGRHVTALAPKGHKVSGGRDQHKRGRDFNCVSCHNPHGTDNPKLFYFGAAAKDMCIYCHSPTGPKKPTQGM